MLALVSVPASALDFETGEIVGNITLPLIDEASGLAMSKRNAGILYTHNDSGGGSYAYAIDTQGVAVARFFLDGADNRDYEDIAVAVDPDTGAPHVYIANTGDNNQVRPTVYVHRFAEPALAVGQGYSAQTVPVRTYAFQYPVAARDCETFFVDPDTGDFYFITKRDARSRVYVAAYPQATSGTTTLSYLGEMQVSNLTGGDISPDGRHMLVKNYAEVYLFSRDEGESILDALLGSATTVPYTPEPKGEGIAFDVDRLGYFCTTEGSPAPLYYYEATDLPPEPEPEPETPFADGVVRGDVSLAALDEISGLASAVNSPGVLFAMNDSGGGAYAHAMTTDGTVVARYSLSGADARDYEDIATAVDPALDSAFVYVANIGDNNAVRSEIQVIRFAEPAVSPGQSYGTTTVYPLTYRFQYPDGARDAESFFVDPATGDFYFLTKRDAKSRIYRAAYPQSISGRTTLEYLGEMEVTGLTAADLSPDGSEILAKTYSEVYWFQRTNGQSIAQTLMGPHKSAPYIPEVKGEAIAFDRGTLGYYTTSEGANAPLYHYDRLVEAGPAVVESTLAIDLATSVFAVAEGETLAFVAGASVSNATGVVFSLEGAPAAARIDPLTGAFQWTPDETDGGTTQSFEVVVRSADPELEDRGTVTVELVEHQAAPRVSPIASTMMHAGETIEIAAQASDQDLPAQDVVFSLGAGVPAGVDIGPASGLVTISADAAQAGQTLRIDVVATDSAGLSGTSGFTVEVYAPLQLTCTELPEGLRLDWNSAPGMTYDLQMCEELCEGDWEVVATVVADGAAASSMIEAGSTAVTVRRCFFRMVPR